MNLNKIGVFAHDKVGLASLGLFISNKVEPTFIVLSDKCTNTLFYLAKHLTENVFIWNGNNKIYNELISRFGIVDLCVLAWWPYIIKDPLFSVSTYGFLNMHPSLLPYNRGKYYYFWTIIENCPFGVSMNWVDASIDGGDIAYQKVIEKGIADTGRSLRDKAEDTMIELFKEKFNDIINLNIPRIKQDLTKGSYHWGNELEVASKINLGRYYKPMELINIIRGRSGFEEGGSWFELDGKKYRVSISIEED